MFPSINSWKLISKKKHLINWTLPTFTHTAAQCHRTSSRRLLQYTGGVLHRVWTTQIQIEMLRNPFHENPQSPPFAQIQLWKTPKLPRLRIPDEEVWRKRLLVRSRWTLSQEWDIWMESPRSEEFEFGQTFRVAGEGAPGEKKPKLFPTISYL